MAANPATVKDSYEVNFFEFGPSSLDILLNFHLEVDGWHGEMTERARIYMEILRLAEELGIGFAFPSQSVYLEGTPDRPYSPPGSSADSNELRVTVESFGPGGSRSRPDGPTISDGFEAG
jgi:MscS family membrane protein